MPRHQRDLLYLVAALEKQADGMVAQVMKMQILHARRIARADLCALFDARNATSDEAFLACWFSDEAQRVLGEMVAMLKAKRG